MGSQGTTKGTWIENVPQVEQPYQVVPEIYEVPSGQHFFHWDPGWDPKTTQQGLKPKMFDRSKNLVKFLWILMRPHHASFFHQDPGWDPKGPPQRRKLKMSDRWKNLFKLLFEFIRSHQDRTFFIRIQDEAPRNNNRGQNRKCMTCWKTLSSFYWIWWGLVRTSLFPLGPRVGSQGEAKCKKSENVWHVETLYQVCIEFYKAPSRHHFFH